MDSSDLVTAAPAVARPPAGGTVLTRVVSGAARPWAIGAILAVVTFVVFFPALDNQWVDWDDNIILVKNERYRGLGWPQLRWMFSNILMGHYIPVTWLTFGLDYVLWGMNPFGYHLTNLLLHSANAVLFYAVALRLLRKATTCPEPALRAGAAIAALFFALHPLRAESVAWATERRDVLSGLLFFVTILLYLRASEREGERRRLLLAGSVACFALGLLSKSIVMTLPLVLILLDLYPLRRLALAPRRWREASVRRAWREKIPYAVLGLAGAVLGYYGQAANSYFTSFVKYPFTARIGMAFYSLWFYVAKTAVPIGLSPLYELPATVHPLGPRFLAPMLGVLLVTVLLLLLRKRWPAGLAAWVAYVTILGPVSGITHAGYHLAHDRYSYLSCLAFAVLAGGGVALGVRAHLNGAVRPAIARAAVAGTAVWLIGLSVLTWHQVKIWRDTDTLWRYAIESDPTCSICHANLGVLLHNQNLPGLAVHHFEQELRLRPDHVKSHHTLGISLAALGRTDEAIEHFRRVLDTFPNEADVLNNLGVALMSQRKFQEALQYLDRAAALDPDRVPVMTNRGLTLGELGRVEEALATLRRAVDLGAKEPLPRLALGRAHLARGDLAAAREQYEILLTLDPRLASVLGASLIDEW
jgi:Flp pilus assembly protein TadD